MHELAITESIVRAVCDRVETGSVTRVVLEVGRLSGVVPDAVRFCFDLCAAETLVEGAALEIREIPGRGRCGDCGAETPLDLPWGICPCGSPGLEIVTGRELRVLEVEVA